MRGGAACQVASAAAARAVAAEGKIGGRSYRARKPG